MATNIERRGRTSHLYRGYMIEFAQHAKKFGHYFEEQQDHFFVSG